jgi:hypothetical protein
VARDFQAPASRLRARWNGCLSKQDQPGHNKKLTSDQQLAGFLYARPLEKIGTSARFPMVTSCANSILIRCHSARTPPPTVDSRWTSRFLRRHPEFHIRKQKTLERQRKQSHYRNESRTRFNQYKTVCDEKSIQLGDRHNFEETGFRIGVGQDQRLICFSTR